MNFEYDEENERYEAFNFYVDREKAVKYYAPKKLIFVDRPGGGPIEMGHSAVLGINRFHCYNTFVENWVLYFDSNICKFKNVEMPTFGLRAVEEPSFTSICSFGSIKNTSQAEAVARARLFLNNLNIGVVSSNEKRKRDIFSNANRTGRASYDRVFTFESCLDFLKTFIFYTSYLEIGGSLIDYNHFITRVEHKKSSVEEMLDDFVYFENNSTKARTLVEFVFEPVYDLFFTDQVGDKILFAPRSKKPTVLYRMFDRKGDLLYVGISSSAQSRFKSHFNTKFWAREINTIQTQFFNSRVGAEVAEKIAIQSEHPKYNIRHSVD